MIIFLSILFSVLITIEILVEGENVLYSGSHSFTNKYGYFSEDERYSLLEEAKSMFYFGYDNYMRYAFPMDELNPINCCGRGPDYDDRLNININDILGDYSLTLVDSLDSLAILGNSTEFQRAVHLVTKFVNFDKDNVVQVFEVNIRIIGALLSAHLIMVDPVQPFGAMKPTWYQDELLHMARDLAVRLLPAFQNSTTGIPYPRVNLRHGNVEGSFSSETCPAGAGTFALEMGILSRLLGDNRFENLARRALNSLWNTRNKETGLLGNVINAETGEWVGKLSGLGAGLDSFYEYLIKSYIMFGNVEDYLMFQTSYQSIKKYMRVGRNKCNSGDGDHPIFVNVNMNTGNVFTPWIDSLQASFAGIQVLDGDIEEAICLHALYYFMWKKYGVLPERWNWKLLSADVMFYPLRPELAESTYLLYQATKSPFYLHVGKDILENLNQFTKTTCGYATVHNVNDMSLEDRMESFFLSETTKYLYLLFDTDHYLNKNIEKYIFNTEGHLLPILSQFRSTESIVSSTEEHFTNGASNTTSAAQLACSAVTSRRQWLPLENKYLMQIRNQFNIKDV